MTNEVTRQVTRTEAAPAGWKKLDLHVHTAFSACYIDHISPELQRTTHPGEILQAAEEAGLDAIAITDHNGVEVLDEIRELARDSRVTVIPGIEFGVRGGHTTALFDLDTPSDRLRELLEALAIPRDMWGDGYRRIDTFMDEVFQVVVDWGGVAIAAHADREPRGFLMSDERPSDKVRIYGSEAMSALELTEARYKARYNAGSDPRYRKPRAVIQSSDSHAPWEIARRYTLFKMDEISLPALRAALADYRNAVLFPQEVNEGTPSR